MARPKNLSLLSIDALFMLRDDVAKALSQKAGALRRQLASLGQDYAAVGRGDVCSMSGVPPVS
jgi:hypothetical protein